MLRLLICSPGDGCGQFHQRRWAGAAALVVIVAGAVAGVVALVAIVAGAVAGVVLDPIASSTSSISEGGPVLLPWS
jgi:hypothetical protein